MARRVLSECSPPMEMSCGPPEEVTEDSIPEVEDEPRCDPCSEKGDNIVAEDYCPDCSQHYCPNCSDVHGRLSITRRHVTRKAKGVRPTQEFDTIESTPPPIRERSYKDKSPAHPIVPPRPPVRPVAQGSQCPVLASPDNTEVLLSSYNTTVGTNVEIECRRFAHHVTPSAVTCSTDGTTYSWNPTPNLTCEYDLDTREKLLLGVFIGAGVLFLLCIICIVLAAILGDSGRRWWMRYFYGEDYFDDQKNYHLREHRRFDNRVDNMDGPRRNYSHYGSVEDIDRYDDFRDRMYMHDKQYVDDRDYWWYRRYHDGDYLPYDVRYMDIEYPQKRFIPVYRDNISDFNDKSNVWYTRQIIDYSDDAKYHRHPSFPPSYHEEPYEPIRPREPIAIVDSPPLEPIEKVALYVEHEPTYTESVYKDIGHYELETVPAPPTPPPSPPQVHIPRNSHRRPQEEYQDIEALYSKPMKSSVRLREIDDHGKEGRELPRVREVRVISVKPDRRRSERETGHHFQRSRDVDQRFRHSTLELHKNGHNFQRNRDVDQRFKHSGDPIVDKNLDHVLYHGKGEMTEVFENPAIDRPRLTATQIY